MQHDTDTSASFLNTSQHVSINGQQQYAEICTNFIVINLHLAVRPQFVYLPYWLLPNYKKTEFLCTAGE